MQRGVSIKQYSLQDFAYEAYRVLLGAPAAESPNMEIYGDVPLKLRFSFRHPNLIATATRPPGVDMRRFAPGGDWTQGTMAYASGSMAEGQFEEK